MTTLSRALRFLVIVGPLGLTAWSCGGRLSELATDAGTDADAGTGSSSGVTSSSSGSGSSSGSSGSSSGSSSDSGLPTQDAAACPQPYGQTAACDTCTAAKCWGPAGGWCGCAQDPTLSASGLPGCVAYLDCEIACVHAGGDIGTCPQQCAPSYTQQEQVDANSLLMCLFSQCSSECDLPGAGGGPVDAGSDAGQAGGADAGMCAAPSQSQCYSCCQMAYAAGATSFFSDVAACLCNGGPCTTACSGASDYCSTPGNLGSQGCTQCVNTYAAPGAVCDGTTGTVAAACQSQPQCTAYLACANGCP